LCNNKQRFDEEERKRQVIDCDDSKFDEKKLFGMLKQAIELMKENPKFVLASLPDVHRLPLLREWILQRYGRRYTRKHNVTRLLQSRAQQQILLQKRIVPFVTIPRATKFGINKNNVTFDEVAELRPAVGKWIKDYKQKQAEDVIKRCRLFWPIMDPYLCNSERMRAIFYDYLPSSARNFP